MTLQIPMRFQSTQSSISSSSGIISPATDAPSCMLSNSPPIRNRADAAYCDPPHTLFLCSLMLASTLYAPYIESKHLNMRPVYAETTLYLPVQTLLPLSDLSEATRVFGPDCCCPNFRGGTFADIYVYCCAVGLVTGLEFHMTLSCDCCCCCSGDCWKRVLGLRWKVVFLLLIKDFGETLSRSSRSSILSSSTTLIYATSASSY